MIPSSITGPQVLYQKTQEHSQSVRIEALVICADCREMHNGLCLGDLTGDKLACPVGHLKYGTDQGGTERE